MNKENNKINQFNTLFQRKTVNNKEYYISNIIINMPWDIPINITKQIILPTSQHSQESCMDIYKNEFSIIFRKFLDFTKEHTLLDLFPKKEIKNIKKQEIEINIDLYFYENISVKDIILNKIKESSDIYLKEDNDYEDIKEDIQNIFLHYDPKKEFKKARNLKRKIYFFCGETNSGKTYHALNKLVESSNGQYLAPLRLLALEGRDEVEKRGKPCSLITGEERNIVENSNFSSSTIEMINFDNVYETIVIDEIQMLLDERRGWAWTKALLGAPAKNLILTGSSVVLPIIKKITEELGEELIIKEFKRKSELKINKHLYDLVHIPDNTAIVTFSRGELFRVKRILQEQGKSSSVIFGSLTPEARQNESLKFSNGTNKVLIATDAISMGLNLPIKHIIFENLFKYNGKDVQPIDSLLAKQISGRAGRYNLHDIGYVGSFDKEYNEILSSLLNKEENIDSPLYIKPSYSLIKELSVVLNTNNIFTILTILNKNKNYIDNKYNFIELKHILSLALHIEKNKIDVDLNEKFKLISAPVEFINNQFEQSDSENIYIAFLKYLKEQKNSFEQGLHNTLIKDILNKTDKVNEFNSIQDFFYLEYCIYLLNMYIWFSYNFEEYFYNKEIILKEKKRINNKIIRDLNKNKIIKG